jgi:succinate dehydrogenase/fumarate reductase cytochrome b subunit
MAFLLELFSTKVAYASLDTFIAKVDELIINPLIGLLFALAVIYFLYGVFQFIANQENEEKKTAGKSHMLWGIIGITIMMGVWVILGIVLNTFGISKSQIDPENGTVNLGP